MILPVEGSGYARVTYHAPNYHAAEKGTMATEIIPTIQDTRNGVFVITIEMIDMIDETTTAIIAMSTNEVA